jgi:hypothetical protein
MTSPCIEDNRLCTVKPYAGNGAMEHDVEPRLPRIFAEATADRVDREPVSEGYRHVTWYYLLLFVSVSSLAVLEPVGVILKDMFSFLLGPISTWLSGASSLMEAIIYRIKRGWLPALALSTCVVAGNKGVVIGTESVPNWPFDVFDYVDPLIGTINGGWFSSFNSSNGY